VRIIAAALDGTLAPLRALVQGIEQRCHYLGFEKEQRAYRPHVTIARARPTLSAKFRAGISDVTMDLWPGPSFSPVRFVLMQSQLSAGGSIYSPVAYFSIGVE
jgi:2'-5' RNA ligase